ncbi:MAG: patatin-like phospholipase family protein [Firmicutes bacterium]|nr:patatin-like phospholipase family protein [Bacillota bacterium]
MQKKEKLALVLAGGGARGAYEVGVWQAMAELGMKIDIVTGSSVGSINGAMVCQGDLELSLKMWKEMETHNVFDVEEGFQSIDYAKEIVLNKGAGSSRLNDLLRRYVDEEKIRASSIEYGLTTVELKTLKPHFLFREDIKKGQLVDYILASSSAFPVIHAHEIDGVEYIDGGYADVMPIDMAIKKGATKVIAVRLHGLGFERKPSNAENVDITIIDPKWGLGETLIFDVDNARKIMRLGYLDAMKAFGIFEGNYFTFAKGTFNKTDLKMADACAKAFDIEPQLIYTKDELIKRLKEAIVRSEEELEDALSTLKHIRSKFVTLNDIVNLAKETDKSHLCILMAQNLKEKGKDSIFASTAASKLIPDAIYAAKFLIKYDLI